uniref:Uncharacterized protein n=1 Tax=Megaselia scalaris TaxID=36166 RepID=T1GHQ6_MEGSC
MSFATCLLERKILSRHKGDFQQYHSRSIINARYDIDKDVTMVIGYVDEIGAGWIPKYPK